MVGSINRVHVRYFSENGGEFKLERQLQNDKYLKIFLHIFNDQNEELGTVWLVEGEVELVNGKSSKKHIIKLCHIISTQAIWIGSWHPYFEKKCSENCNDEIPFEDLEPHKLADKTLVSLSAFTNGIEIESDFLNLIVNKENKNEIQK